MERYCFDCDSRWTDRTPEQCCVWCGRCGGRLTPREDTPHRPAENPEIQLPIPRNPGLNNQEYAGLDRYTGPPAPPLVPAVRYPNYNAMRDGHRVELAPINSDRGIAFVDEFGHMYFPYSVVNGPARDYNGNQAINNAQPMTDRNPNYFNQDNNARAAGDRTRLPSENRHLQHARPAIDLGTLSGANIPPIFGDHANRDGPVDIGGGRERSPPVEQIRADREARLARHRRRRERNQNGGRLPRMTPPNRR
ncbi:hypothetical protein H2200_006256 [Cladophialophora chaetospira]|uniref:Uncharacterized protein n=1 Tax=Cladophialophora chaetospira TaxID=386627 RepID=A0AA39CJ76_9EURO|nr:hypothetical protein H2200_006256 [Cladophialophora chaetospira]